MAGHHSPAHAELAASDPAIALLIERIDYAVITDRVDSRTDDRFEALCRIIAGQQVSTAAARTIWGRVVEAHDGVPTPEQLTAADATETLRAAGLSGRKASYMIGIGEAVLSGELDPDGLDEASDAEVIETLVALRGLGRWSAEMFLMFDLGRPDVFSGGDLGLRRGIQIAYEMEEPPTPQEAEEIAELWSPNRTLASFYLWAAAGGALPVGEPADG
ncbi:MAG: DNA-3-methyladenine glycosylase [Solirubrobacterales bacterium]